MNPPETHPEKRRSLQSMLPLLEQGSAALCTFAINFIASLRMDVVPFVQFTTVWIASILVVTLANAFIFQPAMWAIMHQRKHAPHRIIHLSFALLGAMLALTTAYYLWVMHTGKGESPYNWMTIALIGLISLYEFIRRMLMLSSKWMVSFAINLAMMLGIGASFCIGKPTLHQIWVSLLIIYASAILIGLVVVHGMLIPRGELDRQPGLLRNLVSFGTPLLGAGISFWFISGGYLLLLASHLQPSHSASLRAIQNLFAGIMVLLAAFDNWALAQPNRLTPRQAKFIERLLLGVVSAWGLALTLVAPRLFHKFSVSPLLVILVTLTYAALSSARLWMSIAKQSGDAMLAMNGQTFACVSFLVLMGLQWAIRVPISAISVSLLWTLSMLAMWMLVRQKSSRSAFTANNADPA